jgi:hypothetical protein
MRLVLLLLACDPPANTPAPCNPVTQTCAATERCAITAYAEEGAVTSCLANTGTKAEGEPCTRPATMVRDTLPPDDCAVGMHCSALGGLGTTEGTHQSRCWKYCASDAACDAGKKCITLNESPVIGLCVPTCAAFSACAPGFNCSFVVPDTDGTSAFLSCRESGPIAAGAACGDGTQCAADTICNPITEPRTCIPLCDAAHPCASGNCIVYPGTAISVCF